LKSIYYHDGVSPQYLNIPANIYCRDGNIPDIQSAGSIIEFLDKLHGEFGPIASFWMEKEFTVSIASPQLFKEVSHLFG